MQKGPHPSFEEDEEGYHYIPGQSTGNANYFENLDDKCASVPPTKDDGSIDWGEVIRNINERDGNG